MWDWLQGHAPDRVWWTYLWIINHRNTRGKRTYREHMARQRRIHEGLWG